MTEPKDTSSDFMRLYMTHESKIRGYVLCMVNNWADADDILQEAAIVMMKKYKGFDSKRGFLHWALRVAHFEVLNHVSNKRNRLPLFSPEVLEAIEERAAREIQRQDTRVSGCHVRAEASLRNQHRIARIVLPRMGKLD